jgi:glycosyltransferase involved in cell wall biosynthesis
MRMLERIEPDFIYQRYDAFAWLGVEAAERAGVPAVLEWNSSEVWTRAHWHAPNRLKHAFDPLLRGIERYVVERPAVVAAVSRRAAEMALAAGADPERVLVVPNAVDIEAIDWALGPDAARATAPRSPRPPRVGWVGSFGSWHGAEVLVRALALLGPEVSGLFIGDGPARPTCQALAEELGVADRIEWTGLLANAEAIRRLADCDVLASPHVPLPGQAFFGSPTKLFEFMAIGRPIVASRLEQIGELLDDGETALLFEPGDVEGLARAIDAVLESDERGRALGEAARRLAESAHRWEHRAQAILRMLAAGERTGAQGACAGLGG